MQQGYLLGTSHRTLGDLFDQFGIDIHAPGNHHGSGSKANLMREFWERENDALVNAPQELMDRLHTYAARYL